MKSSLKRILVIALITTVSLFMFGCNAQSQGEADSGSGDAGKIKIGVTENLRIEYVANLEKELTSLIKGTDMEIVGMFAGNGDAQKHFEHIATFVQQGVDIIIMHTQDTSAAAEYVKAAQGIPIIFLNNKPPEDVLAAGGAYFVGCDETKAGRIEGEYVAKILKEQGKTECNYVVLMGQLGMETTNIRTAGAVAALEEAGFKMNEVLKDTGNWAREGAIEKLTPILGIGKQIDCVLANNDEMALGAIEALKSAKMDKGVIVCGIDGIESALDSIQRGELAVTALITPYDIANKAVEMIPQIVNHENIEHSYELAYVAVTKDNVDQYLKK